MINKTILRQYSNSPVIKSVIYNFDNAISNKAVINDFVDNVMNINTANSYGLDILGAIVGASRYVNFGEITINSEAGFYGQNLQTMSYGTYYAGEKSTNTARLGDDFYKTVIKVKASQNISGMTIKEINKDLLILFKNRGKPFITDNGDMSINYVFTFFLRDNEIALLRKGNILHTPSGVNVNAIVVDINNTVGFYGSNGQTMNHGTFFDKKGLINGIR